MSKLNPEQELIVRTDNESHQSRPTVRQRRTNKSFYSSSGSQGIYPKMKGMSLYIASGSREKGTHRGERN
jgi:hypothetical protein